MSTLLVRPPSPRLQDGLLTHIERSEVDADLARRQWDDYVSAWHRHGWQIREVDPEPDLPDSVFIEDTMVVRGSTAVIARPGAPERVPETTAAEQEVARLGLRIQHMSAPATLDGGDVMQVGDRCYVGVGGRTNLDGCRQLGELLGIEAVPVPVRHVLHLKSAVTALPDGTVIGYPGLLDDVSVFDRFRAVPEETGSHIVVMDPDTVLMASSAPKTADLLGGAGFAVVRVDISEFEKLEGCVTCLSVRLRGL